jgi:hypothetical protein
MEDPRKVPEFFREANEDNEGRFLATEARWNFFDFQLEPRAVGWIIY